METENTTVEMESADQHDYFLEGWGDDSPVTEDANQQTEEAEEETTEESAEVTETEEEGQTETESDTTEEAADTKSEEQTEEKELPTVSWNVKVLGEDKVVGVNDVTPEILQKGFDYDRIRTKYDEAKPVMEMFSEFAQKAGMTVTDYVKHIRTAAKKAEGMTDTEAKRAIDLEDREAAVSAKEAEQKEAEEKNTAQTERINADIAEFAKAFPDIYKEAKDNPKAIPQKVWDDVHNNGLTLTSAYAKYQVELANDAVKAAQALASAAAQNAKNSIRSTGSMKSAGNDTKNTDAFLEGWNS